jgi:hypothetical protein
MTHEATPNGEAHAGPEHDHTLPDAGDVPVYADPAESDAALLDADLDVED